MTGGTDILEPPFPIAARACEAELHRARHLGHVAGAVALRAHRGGAADRSASVAGIAGLLMQDVQFDLGAADRFPEIDIEAVFEIRPFLGRRGALAAPAAE